MRWLIPLLLILPGCAGVQLPTHYQTSDEWAAPGAWDALPDQGNVGGYDVQTIFFSPGDDAHFAPTDLDAWGDHVLQFVRWYDGGTDRTVQFEPGYVQVWLPIRYDADEARRLFMQTAPHILDADEAALERMADRIVASERRLEARPATDTYEGRPERLIYGIPIDRPEYEALYAALGGIQSMDAETRIDAQQFLPMPGKVTLSRNAWEFHMVTNLKRATAGSEWDGDLIWVAPTDVVQFVHQGHRKLSDEAAASQGDAALEALELSPRDDWRFTHEMVEASMGD